MNISRTDVQDAPLHLIKPRYDSRTKHNSGSLRKSSAPACFRISELLNKLVWRESLPDSPLFFLT